MTAAGDGPLIPLTIANSPGAETPGSCRVMNLPCRDLEMTMRRSWISELTGILKPPAKPLDTDPSGLARNEERLRIRFPRDFVEFGATFGSGCIDVPKASWEVWSPFRPTYPAIVREFYSIWPAFRDASEMHDVPLGLFPEPGCLLPFATTPDGGWVCWKTAGDPERWDVVDMSNYEAGQYDIFELTATEYFYKVLSRQMLLDRQHSISWDPNEVSMAPHVFADQGLDPDSAP